MKNALLAALALLTGLAAGLLFNFGVLDGSGHAALAGKNGPMVGGITAYEGEDPAFTESVPLANATPTPAPDLSANRVLISRAFSAATAIKQRDFDALAALAHPVKEITFTPYSTADPDANLSFSAAELKDAADRGQKYIWGISDGRGEAIELTVSDYFSRYVYNADYLQAPVIGVNKVIGQGNSLENVETAYPEGRFVEFHFPGLVEKYGGLDWCSLKLVFEAYEGDFKLVGVIHSEWTV